MNKLNVSCTVNGDLLDFDVAPNRSLLDALRTEMGLTGTKKAAMWANAAPAPSCSMAALPTPA
jgi:aerobic-type carbon monoxide dehydrogenase small subunit (CoxS/CutS family)